MLRMVYSRKRLDEALATVLGSVPLDSFNTRVEAIQTAGLQLLTQNWSLHFDTPKIIIQALKDLEQLGYINYADKEENNEKE